MTKSELPATRPTDIATRADWPQIGDIIPNHDADRPPRTNALAGRAVSLRFSDGETAEVIFRDADRLTGRIASEDIDVAYDGYEVRDDCYFINWRAQTSDRRTRSLFLDLLHERALLVEGRIPTPDANRIDTLTRIADRKSQSVVYVVYRAALIGDGAEAIGRTAELVGKCLRYRYSDTHLYDHIYHSERYYSWFCHNGPDRGLGDFEECDYFKLRDELYLICWREKLLPCLAVMVEDHQAMRSMGRIIGGDAYTGEIADTMVGARMSLVADIGLAAER